MDKYLCTALVLQSFYEHLDYPCCRLAGHVAAHPPCGSGPVITAHEFGRVVVMDIVAHEASEEDEAVTRELADWLRKGQELGSNQPVEVVKTEIGEAYRLARQTDPSFTTRDAGERAIRDWLVIRLSYPKVANAPVLHWMRNANVLIRKSLAF